MKSVINHRTESELDRKVLAVDHGKEIIPVAKLNRAPIRIPTHYFKKLSHFYRIILKNYRIFTKYHVLFWKITACLPHVFLPEIHAVPHSSEKIPHLNTALKLLKFMIISYFGKITWLRTFPAEASVGVSIWSTFLFQVILKHFFDLVHVICQL